MHMDMSQEPFTREFSGKMPQTKTATTALCEPAQSKCTWTCRKSHFMRECRKPHGAPWSSTSLNSYLYPKNPSVWTHSLAKDMAYHRISCQGIEMRGLQRTLTTPHQQHANCQKSHSAPVSTGPAETGRVRFSWLLHVTALFGNHLHQPTSWTVTGP